MDNFLREQVSQRASNTDRLNNLIQQTKGEQFEEWRNDANKLFDSQLNDYSNKASEYVQQKIASTSEGAGVLTQVPHFYSLGTGFYKNVLGEQGKTALDDTARGLKIVKDKINGKVVEKTGVNIEKTAGDIKTRVNNIADQLEGNVPQSSTKLYNYKDVQTSEVPRSEMAPQTSEMLEGTNNPFSDDFDPPEVNVVKVPEGTMAISSEGGGNITMNPDLITRNRLANVSTNTPSESVQNTEVTPVTAEQLESDRTIKLLQRQTAMKEAGLSEATTDTSADSLGTSVYASGESGITTSGAGGTATVVDGALVEGGLDADAALAATGVGAPLAGLLAVGGAIAFGLEELFHHSHKPKAPVMPYSSSASALSSQYNISSTILPTTSSLQERAGTMTF